MTSPVTSKTQDNICVITIDNPPVNALGHAVRAGLMAEIEQADGKNGIDAIVLIGQGRTFPAGADIREFGKPLLAPGLPDVVNRIEACTKPVIAALHGTALGGGLEVALGAHVRIATHSARVGLPEVHLGILPGAGGTQRLPRLIGVEAAVEIMVSGEPVPANRAHSLGVIDRLTDDDLETGAIEYAKELATQPPRRTKDLETPREGADDILAAMRERLGVKMRGQHAPFRILDCVQASLDMPFDEGLAYERAAFVDCMATPQSKGLIHAFFADRASAKVPEAGRGQPRPLDQIGIIGGGTMGAGITVAMLDAGLPVTMVERGEDGIRRGRANVEKVYDRHIAKGRLTAEQKAGILKRFLVTTDLKALQVADLIIEAAFEEIDVKKSVFADMDAIAKDGAILASNTSYLDIDVLAAETSRPQDVIGLHFFSPANIMKLLEIVVPAKAGDDAVATGFALAKRLRKIPVRAKNADGFIGNRLLKKYSTAVSHMVEDGASPYHVDRVLFDFGYPMGPHAVYDLAGLDIGWANRKKDAPNRSPDERYVEIADRICEKGWFGQKTGRGFYRYENGNRRGIEDPEVLEIIDAERTRKGISPRTFTDQEILRRFIAAMVNEAAEVLREGIALKPSDIDVTLLHGYAFPRYRGGPMHYADTIGLDRILADIEEFSKEDPHFWKPSSLLTELVNTGRNFASLNTG